MKQPTAETSHATIITSGSPDALEKAALELAAGILCSEGGKRPCGSCKSCRLTAANAHPDLIFVDRLPDDKGKLRREIYVDQIRAMSADAWVLPHLSDKKVYVIREAHKMNLQAQNAALKILEEPPEWASFILCADNDRHLLSTIRSRCRLVRAEWKENFTPAPQALKLMELLEKGDHAELCAFWVSMESLDSEELRQLLENIRTLASHYILEADKKSVPLIKNLFQLIELCLKGEKYLKYNVGAKHVTGMMNGLCLPEMRKLS